jgi:DNA-directed RNA polymerase subunit omega
MEGTCCSGQKLFIFIAAFAAEWRIIMMLYPPVAELVDKIGSRYQLVNLVAKRARTISSEAEEKQIPLERKAVSTAIEEVYTGKLSIEHEQH